MNKRWNRTEERRERERRWFSGKPTASKETRERERESTRHRSYYRNQLLITCVLNRQLAHSLSASSPEHNVHLVNRCIPVRRLSVQSKNTTIGPAHSVVVVVVVILAQQILFIRCCATATKWRHHRTAKILKN